MPILYNACKMAIALVLAGIIFFPARHIFHAGLETGSVFEGANLKNTSVEKTSGVESSAIAQGKAPHIAAISALVYDPISKEYLYEKESSKELGIASLTKIMAALIAYERTEDLDAVPVSKEAVATEGFAGDLSPGEWLHASDLIRMMLMESSNDATVAMAEFVGRRYGAESFDQSQEQFIRLMNERARSLELSATSFKNPTGLDVEDQSLSNISSARDITKLVAATFIYPKLWEVTAQEEAVLYSREGKEHAVKNINFLASLLPGFIGGKTGYTDLAGGALVVILEAPVAKPKIIVILGSTYEGRFEDAIHLSEWLLRETK